MKDKNIDLIELFLEKISAEDGLSKNSIDSYGRDLKLFCQFFSNESANKALNKKNLSINQINDKDVSRYLNYLFEKGVKSSSLSRKISSLRNFYKFLENEGEINENPLKNIENPKKESRLPKFLSEKDTFKLLDFAEKDKSEFGIKLSCILEILYGSGLRITELVTMPISLIQKDQNNILKNYFIVKGKGGKERIVPLSKSAIEKLQEYLKLRENMGCGKSKWLFCGNIRSSKTNEFIKNKEFLNKKDQPITRQRVNQMLKELALKAGLDPRKISPHILRHSFATHLLNNGINIRYLQEMLGHATIGTTEIYTHILDDKLQELVLKNHPLNKERGDI